MRGSHSGAWTGERVPGRDVHDVIAEHLYALADRYEAGRLSWTDAEPFGCRLLGDLFGFHAEGAIGWSRRIYLTFCRAAGVPERALNDWLDCDASLADVIRAVRVAAGEFARASAPPVHVYGDASASLPSNNQGGTPDES